MKKLFFSILVFSIFATDAKTIQQDDLTDSLHKECSLYGKVKQETHPVLWNLITEVAQKLDTKVPSYIYIYNKPDGFPSYFNKNAFVFFNNMFIGKFVVNNLTYDEAKAVIAHELSHQAKQHVYKKLGILLGVFTTVGLVTSKVKTIQGKITTTYIGLLASLPIRSYFSRYFEKEADLNALKSTEAKDLISSLKAIKKATKGNKIQIFRDSKFVKKIKHILLGSHPTVEEREKYILAAANN